MTSNTPAHVLLEGFIKHRDNRKWKSRWAVVSKLSPVADCLHITLYGSFKTRNVKPKRVIVLESSAYLGIESGFTLENESNTLAIVFKSNIEVIALETHEIMHQWQNKLQCQFWKEHHFSVNIVSLPPKSSLQSGPARMLLSESCFCLVSGIPPRLLGFWQMEHLRRFGALDGKSCFCFEGGSQCGKGIGLHVLYTNQAGEISKFFELASCGQLNLGNLQASDCDGYYRKGKESLLYKYANGASSKEVPKSASSDSSSTCDSSCSQVLSLGEEHCRSGYLNVDGSKCSLYHSSITLNCHEQLSLPTGKVCTGNCQQRHNSICNASFQYKCHCAPRSSMFSASTISRLSNVKCDLTQECHLASVPSPPDTLKACSPSTVSQCFIASDRESLFSQSSQGSNSSSGCSSLTCADHNQCSGTSQQANGGSIKLAAVAESGGSTARRHEQIIHERDAAGTGKKCPGVLSRTDATRDGSINGYLSAPSGTHCEKWSHLYSQINFIKQSSQSQQMANYDIPRNLCVNADLFNQNTESYSASQQRASTINHCHCDTVQPNGGNETTRDWRALNGADSIMHDRGSGRASPESTLIRRTKQHFLQSHAASVPDNESDRRCGQQETIKHADCPSWSTLNDDDPGIRTLTAPTDAEQSASLKTATQCMQPNYANMQFIRSIELYENLRFDPPHQSNCSRVIVAHSLGGDESIIGVPSRLEGGLRERRKMQSPTSSLQSTLSPNCPSHHTDWQSQCTRGDRDALNDAVSAGDELPTDPTNGGGDAISKSTDKSMNGGSVCPPSARPRDAVRGEECTAGERDNDEAAMCSGEGQASGGQQDGSNSLAGSPRAGNSKRANNGAHYHHRHHHLRDGLQDGPKNVNISLSSLHNRTSCKRPTRRDCNCACRGRGAKWSISNAISGAQLKHHRVSRPLLRPKSYSFDNVTTIGPACDCNCSSMRPNLAAEWTHTPLVTTSHNFADAWSAGTLTRNRRSTWPNLARHGHCSVCSDCSDSEDFCTSSQITILCQTQTGSV